MITRQDREAAGEIRKLAEEQYDLGYTFLVGSAWEVDLSQVAAIIARHTQDGELRKALRSVTDTLGSIGGQHSKSYLEARATLTFLDVEDATISGLIGHDPRVQERISTPLQDVGPDHWAAFSRKDRRAALDAEEGGKDAD